MLSHSTVGRILRILYVERKRKKSKQMVVVQFEKRFVSGRAFRHAAKNRRVPGFSRCAATGKPRRLKPFTLVALVASLKRCPDTNLFSNCTITRISVNYELERARSSVWMGIPDAIVLLLDADPRIASPFRFRQPTGCTFRGSRRH